MKENEESVLVDRMYGACFPCTGDVKAVMRIVVVTLAFHAGGGGGRRGCLASTLQ